MENRECPICKTNKHLYCITEALDRKRISCNNMFPNGEECTWSILTDHNGNIIDEAELKKKAQEWQ